MSIPLPEYLPNVDGWQLSSDEKNLYDIAKAISDGECSIYLATRKPGIMHHARWLTKASGVLRVYVAMTSPSQKLIILVLYIMKVYIPMYFSIKHKSSCAFGSVHLSKFILYSRILADEHLNIVHKVLSDNAYFAHPENILFPMIHDERSDIRNLAYQKIMSIRENTENDKDLRPYILPRFNFNCDNYMDMINWNNEILDEPAYRNQLSASSPIEDIRIPCHTQATERHIKIVTSVCQNVSPAKRG